MALKSTIFKAVLQIADMDRNYYGEHVLTLARHPSETDERMMVRLLAFALHADAALSFGRGLSADDEADLWHKDLTGAIETWIDVGLPDEKLVRKACGRARRVFVYSYGGRAADLWWQQASDKFERLSNLSVLRLPAAAGQDLAKISSRNMQIQCTIQDEHIWFSGQDLGVELALEKLKTADF